MANKMENKKRFTNYNDFFKFVYENFELMDIDDFITNHKSFEEREEEIEEVYRTEQDVVDKSIGTAFFPIGLHTSDYLKNGFQRDEFGNVVWKSLDEKVFARFHMDIILNSPRMHFSSFKEYMNNKQKLRESRKIQPAAGNSSLILTELVFPATHIDGYWGSNSSNYFYQQENSFCGLEVLRSYSSAGPLEGIVFTSEGRDVQKLITKHMNKSKRIKQSLEYSNDNNVQHLSYTKEGTRVTLSLGINKYNKNDHSQFPSLSKLGDKFALLVGYFIFDNKKIPNKEKFDLVESITKEYDIKINRAKLVFGHYPEILTPNKDKGLRKEGELYNGQKKEG